MEPHRIDVHHHILPPDYVAAVGDDRIGPLILAGRTPEWTPAMSVEAMDRHGVATAVTSISAPGLWFGDDEESARLARLCNEYAAGIRRDHPGRFGMFASLPLPDVDASLAEIEHALDTFEADGIGLLTSYGDRYPGDPAFAPVFDELDRRGAVVYFHPTDAPCSQCLPEIPAATLDFPFDTTRAVVSLLYSGTFARCRNVRFIFWGLYRLLDGRLSGADRGRGRRRVAAGMETAQTPPRHGRRRPTIHDLFFVSGAAKTRGWSAFADHDGEERPAGTRMRPGAARNACQPRSCQVIDISSKQ